MMHKKRFTGLMAVLLSAVLAGCGSGQGSSQAGTSGASNAGGAASAESTKTQGAAAVATTAAEGTADSSESSSSPSVEETADAADTDGYLNAVITAEPTTLDCARFLSMVDRNILQNITEPLTRIQDGQVTAAGAESWDISDDGLTITFHLRDNQWEDGQAVKAADYLYALKREADPANAFTFASDFFSVKNFEEIYNGEAAVDDLGVVAEDDSTLVITLDSPNPAFLSSVDIFPCREDSVEAYGDRYGSEAETMLSCGPFRLTGWTHNSELTFARNENYWDKDSVKLASFTYLIMTDESAQMASLENGSVDYSYVYADEYAQKFSANTDMYEQEVTTDRTAMLVFNCEDAVFSNTKIRQAFSLAVDRDQVVEIVASGLGQPAYGLVPTVCYVGNTNYRNATPEPLKALQEENPDPKALLAEGMEEAGLGNDPSSLTVTLSYGGTSADARTSAELYQQMWQNALGVTVEIEFNESSTHLANVREGNYQIASVAWGSTYEPSFQLSRWATPTGGQSRWVNEEYQNLVAAGQAELEEDKRLADYQEAEKLLVTEAAIAPLYYNETRTFAWNYVKNLVENPFDTTGMKLEYTSGR